ncbi:MAG: pyrimidine dimer DNA glycosylase/endonuclease V [Buchananella hordeovulneris]|nr:pyrimidine dimer DNA glycosylase/endonuclease V [Buchananella hordeovulneris]
MRLWSLHPSHLDRAGLVAGWREALLAQAVMAGKTKGYQHHPQLWRFQQHPQPLEAMGAFLVGLQREATARGYRFDASKILHPEAQVTPIDVTAGQLDYEWAHLGAKLAARSPEFRRQWEETSPTPHPLFRVVVGEVKHWERT